MKCKILHQSSGRLRVRFYQYQMSFEQADTLEFALGKIPGVKKAKVNDRTLDAVITFESGAEDRIIKALSEFSYEDAEPAPEHSGRALAREYEDRFFFLILRRCITRFVMPARISDVVTALHAVKYIYNGIKSLASGHLDVAVLDATTITVSSLRGDFRTAGTVMFLLGVSELLEEWTHKKSVDDLAQRMYLNVDRVWVRKDGTDELLPVNEVNEGDHVVVRTGNLIPLDGRVTEGEASVNRASMTGESLPVFKNAGSFVYAGTVVEDGECVIEVTNAQGSGRYDRIVSMIEDAEKLKSATESRAFHLADRLVPWCLGGTALTWLLTRNVTKAMAVLMVDFSCALKLALPITVLSAIREASDHHIDVKGGKYLENVAQAKTIVFDKTGTLTYAQPHVADIIAFDGYDRDEMLRLAACLEEHFPHSMANAVVAEAEKRGLNHAEKHSEVEYVVAHGIASSIDGQHVCIGSYHFIFEDEKCTVPEGEEHRFEEIPAEYSRLYLAIGGTLSAVICVEDPIREEAPAAIRALKESGFDKVVMMTGDSRTTAAAVAAKVGVDQFFGEVLPEDKAAFIRSEHEKGRKVVMTGDGINDSPALSEADAGIAVASGAAIARDVADITISAESLYELVVMKRLADAMMGRIHRNYSTILIFNSALIFLGLFGILPPTVTATLHNLSTLLISMNSMRDLLPEGADA